MGSAAMEEELKCPVCRRLFTNPVLLPCSHSLCLKCAVSLQMPAQQLQQAGSSSGESDGGSQSGGGEGDLSLEADKLSLMSETDSGVVVSSSRPNSYVGTPSFGSQFFHILGNSTGINCPVCKHNVYLDDQGANALPKNRCLEAIVDKYGENKNITVHCQLCESKTAANLMCEQCEVFYCEECKDSCHPARGPLAQHNLVAPAEGKALLRAKHKSKESKCGEHKDEKLSMYCGLCRATVCCVCVQDGRHINHDAQPLGATAKSQKQELSQLLQTLSEKAKSGTEFIQRLKSMEGRIEDNTMEFEAKVVAQCDALMEAIRTRKQQLLDSIVEERKHKERVFREQVAHCTQTLQKTMALLQFSIEVLKETDPTAFLQVSGNLIGRVGGVEQVFNKDMELTPRVSSDFELSLDDSLVLRHIKNLNFFQMKAPDAPQFLMEECSAENNTVMLAWQSRTGTVVDGYTLELDDGSEGDFHEVYTGKETMCTVEGLHFDSVYNARVKAFNHAGESDYSECICLQTAPVAWFTMDPSTSHPDIVFSNENTTVTSNSFDDAVVLGHVGFSRGVHYWEITLDRYENTPDPAFGIARFDVTKDAMLGRDEKGWSMYIDSKRSWFMHGGQHSDRTEGGIQAGSVIGVLLDLNNHTISYQVDHVAHGPIAFTGLAGVYYPAISLNRNVQVTIHSGLEVPPELPETESDDD